MINCGDDPKSRNAKGRNAQQPERSIGCTPQSPTAQKPNGPKARAPKSPTVQ